MGWGEAVAELTARVERLEAALEYVVAARKLEKSKPKVKRAR